eukprot:3773553-Amphidinium_carterae.1
MGAMRPPHGTASSKAENAAHHALKAASAGALRLHFRHLLVTFVAGWFYLEGSLLECMVVLNRFSLPLLYKKVSVLLMEMAVWCHAVYIGRQLCRVATCTATSAFGGSTASDVKINVLTKNAHPYSSEPQRQTQLKAKSKHCLKYH